MNSTRESLLGLVLVVVVHGGAVGAMLWTPTPKSKELVLPTIQGVVIPAPPAEAVQVPSAKEPPPPVERPPEPEKPKPKPKPKEVPPKPKPKPAPPPVEAPPSENAITQEEEAVEKAAATPPPPVAVQATRDDDTLGAPIVPPRQDANPLNNPAPAYPTASRRMREQGIVLLQVLILPDGSVGEVRIKESSGHQRLDDTAIKAVKQWKYIPARQGDKTIAYWYLQPLEFSLH